MEKKARRGTFRPEDLAQVYTMIGEQGKALDVLERLLAIPSECTRAMRRSKPRWRSLPGNVRVLSLMREQQE